jgi:cytochrome P450
METCIAAVPTSRDRPLDPPAELSNLRSQRPLCRLSYPDGHLGWFVTSHHLARAVLTDSRFSVRGGRSPHDLAERNAAREAVKDSPIWSGVVSNLDPPDHTRLRQMQSGHFTIQRSGRYRRAISGVVAELLDELATAGGPVDLLDAFAGPVASLTLCEVLGIPRSARERFEELQGILRDLGTSRAEFLGAFQDLQAFIADVLELKRSEPGEDLLSELIHERRLTEAELCGIAHQLFTAGHDTTSTQLATSVYTLLTERRLWESLQADPGLVEQAIEELLRYLTITPLAPATRTALEDVELNGSLIKAGDSVSLSLLAANRDPSKFHLPDVIDLRRAPIEHLAFGAGRHMCLGQHLVRLELGVALASLLERFPTLHLAVPADQVPMRHPLSQLYGVQRLPVAW